MVKKKVEGFGTDVKDVKTEGAKSVNPTLEVIIDHQCKTLDKMDKTIEKVDACLDACKDLVKVVGSLKDATILKKKAGNF